MTLFFQMVTGVALLGLVVVWGGWIRETYWPLTVPQTLSEVSVHGAADGERDALARSLGFGIVATIEQHYRDVAFIKATATQANLPIISIDAAAPEPLLVPPDPGGEPLKVNVEFAGAKIDSSGWLGIVQRRSSGRGALSLAVSMVKGKNDEYVAVASASFPANGDYGFRVQKSGGIDAVSEAIGLRFLQAHYATSDPFHNALSGEDFVKLWAARRQAAELALRVRAGDVPGTGELKREAQTAYDAIAPLLLRYVQAPEIQRLGTYLAQLTGDVEKARMHALAARKHSVGDMQTVLDGLISTLELDISNRAGDAGPATAAAARALPVDLKASLADLTIQNRPLAQSAGLDALLASGARVRPTRIGVVLTRLPKSWDAEVEYVAASGTSADADGTLAESSTSVVSLLKSIAPDAAIVVSPVGPLSAEAIVDAYQRLLTTDVDVAFVPFGAGGADADPWVQWFDRVAEASRGYRGLTVLPSGNMSLTLPAPKVASTSIMVVGALNKDLTPAPFTNTGPAVPFATADEVHVLREGKVTTGRGTSYSGAIAAMGAALLAATSATPVAGAELRAAIAASAREKRPALSPLNFAASRAELVKP